MINAAHFSDPRLREIATMPAERLVRVSTQTIWELLPSLRRNPMVVGLMRRSNIRSFTPDEVDIDVVAIYSRPNEICVEFDFLFREKPTATCRKGRVVDGEAALILRNGYATFYVNHAQADRDDSAVANPPLPINPT